MYLMHVRKLNDREYEDEFRLREGISSLFITLHRSKTEMFCYIGGGEEGHK